MLKEIALIPDDDWKQGAVHVAGFIAEIEARFSTTNTDIPQQDELLRVERVAEVFDVVAAHPEGVEFDDKVKQRCHDRLKQSLEELARASGNMHPNLSDRARLLLEKLETEFEELDLLDIHLDLEDLRGTYERRDEFESEDVLSAEEVRALESVGRLGPGLVRDNEDVELFETRVNRGVDVSSEQVAEAESTLLAGITDREDLAGAHLRGISKGVAGADPDSRPGFVRRLVSWNTVLAVGGFCSLAVASKTVGDSGAAGLAWLWEYAEPARIIAAERGASAAAWLELVLAEVQEILGIAKGSSPSADPKVIKKK